MTSQEVNAAIGFPIVIEQFWTLRNYTLFHNGLRDVREDVV
jgi:hypothetical protein